MSQKKIKVLIVDDSALVRQILVEIMKRARDIEVVGTASDPFMARDRIKELNPDVLTLDVEMPRMDGLTFLSNLMRLRPMPVVMVSSLTEQGADTTLKALELGAIDFVSKPKIDLAGTLADFGGEILAKIRIAAGARVHARSAPVAAGHVSPKYSADAVLPAGGGGKMLRTTDRIIAIGASTGGTEAIREVLMGLPADCPAPDDATHQLGDAEEGSLAEALTFIRTGSCTPSTAERVRALRVRPKMPRLSGWDSLINAQ